MIRCKFYELGTGQCLDAETRKFLKTSACYTCNSGKDYLGRKLKHPICVLTCGECEEETCNIGDIIEAN
jgi:hypothetical protein